MPEPVHVLGGWQTDFARKAGDGGLYGLLAEAVPAALADAGVDPSEIEVAHVGNLAGELFCGQAPLGAMLATVDPAFHGLPTARHEAACASGSIAVLAAMAEIEAGRYDVALVAGVEIQRNRPGKEAAELMGCAQWVGPEGVDEEFPWPAQFAEVADDRRWSRAADHRWLGSPHRPDPVGGQAPSRRGRAGGVPHVQATVADALGRASCPDVFALDALEVHDCFSISEYVAIDHAGITEPGRSWEAVEDDVIGPGGKLPSTRAAGSSASVTRWAPPACGCCSTPPSR